MNIRIATTQDIREIQKVYFSAFSQGERELVYKVAVDLLSENTPPQTISLVAAADSSVVGHVAFSPIAIDNNKDCFAYILAPLAVHADYQRRSIGSKLVKQGMQLLTNMGVNIVFVYGDPGYYGRFGFSEEAASGYLAPYPLQYPFGWQAIVLKDCAIQQMPVKISCVAPLCDPTLW